MTTPTEPRSLVDQLAEEEGVSRASILDALENGNLRITSRLGELRRDRREATDAAFQKAALRMEAPF